MTTNFVHADSHQQPKHHRHADGTTNVGRAKLVAIRAGKPDGFMFAHAGRDARHGGATLPREASEGAVGERTGRAVDVWSRVTWIRAIIIE